MNLQPMVPHFRMGLREYQEFEKRFPPPVLPADSNDQQAAFRLGVQAVLAELRKEYVVAG